MSMLLEELKQDLATHRAVESYWKKQYAKKTNSKEDREEIGWELRKAWEKIENIKSGIRWERERKQKRQTI